MNRGDVYNQVDSAKKQFLVVGKVNGMARGKDGLILFVQVEDGEVRLHAEFHRRPVHLPSHCPAALFSPEVLFHDRSRPVEVAIGTMVRAICEPTDYLPHAVRWCTEAEYEACRREIQMIHERRQIDEEVAMTQALDDLAKNPQFVVEPRRASKQRAQQLVAA